MLSTARLGLTLPPIHELPTRIYDALISCNIPSLTRYLVTLYGRPHGWLGRMIGHVMSFEHGPITQWVLDLMNLQSQDRVLDIGCGSGKGLEQMALRACTGFVAGLDHSETMILQALARNQEQVHAGRVAVHRGDAGHMPFADGSFDKVLSIETLYFWPDPKPILAEIHRILTPGGRVAIALEYTKDSSRTASLETSFDPSLEVRFYSSAELLKLFEEAGFSQLRCETQPSRSNGWLYVEGTKPSPEMDGLALELLSP